jgi:hypothetical protein
MNEFLKKICVRTIVTSGEGSMIEGTGFFLKSNGELYVLTAYHCIYGDDEVDDVEIVLERQDVYNGTFTKIDTGEILQYNQIEDWVLIKVKDIERLTEIPDIHLCSDFSVEQSVKFRGFQAINNQHGRTFVARVIDRPSNKEFRISLTDEDRFRNGADDARGLSGSGAFFERNGRIYLTGLLKKVTGEEALNNDIKCCPPDSIAAALKLELLDMNIDLTIDHFGIEEFDKISVSDTRTIMEKVQDVCSTVSNHRIAKMCRDLAKGKIELSVFTERELSAIKYRIFEECQDELISFIDQQDSREILMEDINGVLEKFTSRGVKIIQAKSKTHNYVKLDEDLIKKIILDLINDCYLSFDKEGIYEA